MMTSRSPWLRRFSQIVGIASVSALFAAATDAAEIAVTPSAKPPTTPAVRTVVLQEQDWKRAPRSPLAPSEIDRLLAREWQAGRLRIEPAPRTCDEQFLRRVTLDLTGQLPEPRDIADFVASTDPRKRGERIERLLVSDAYARHWARFWRDVVSARVTNRRSAGLTRSFEEWLFEQLRDGASWGEIVRSILTAEGELRFTLNTPSSQNGALFFLVARDADEAEERAAETSRVFMGVQIQCAQCHNHPTESWTREQFHEFAAYFSRIKYEQLFDQKKLSGVQLTLLPDREHKVTSLADPEKSSIAHPRFLDGQAPAAGLGDRERRRALADVVTDSQNQWFAAAYVNRIWGELMGRSFYRHVDDLGPSKEVIYPELLTALTGSFQATGYDVRALFRTIVNSDAYQREIGADPRSDRSAPFAAASTARLRADVLWDSLVHLLGKLEHGARFHTGGGVRFNASFLEGRFRAEFDFDPSLDQEEVEGAVPQALFLMNNPILNKQLQTTKTNMLGRLLRDCPENPEAVRQAYLLALARRPTERELARCVAYVGAAPSRAEGLEDVVWTLINSTEFQRKR